MDLLTVVDLAIGEVARVRTRVGEPGVTVLGGGDPLVLLRHREPGALAVRGFPHGSGRLPRGHASRAPAPAPAPAPVGRWAWECTQPEGWRHARGRDGDWLETGRTLLTELGPGLVFRLTLARERHRLHLGGDELEFWAPTTPFAAPRHGLRAAARRYPWEGVERRVVAASPGSDWVAVTRGGHGEVHLADAGDGTRGDPPETSAPLHHGGPVMLLSRNDGADGDPAGR
ncbi:hypothetical protein [Streptomyces sp. NPDC059928]|uniref:hypothetical protein n=1 Tax=unclassified Streptomyces TaxID=2593676 RepID=UPI00364A455A